MSTLKPSLLLAYPDENGNQGPDPDPDPDLVEREAALLPLCDHDYGVNVENGLQPLLDHDYQVEVAHQPESFKGELFEVEPMDVSESEQLKKEYATLAEKEMKVRRSRNRLKRLNRSLRAKLKENLKAKKVTSDILYECSVALKRCKSEVPIKIFHALVTKRKRLKQYCPVLRKFAATLDLCSPKAYR